MIKKFMSQMAQPPQTISTSKAGFQDWDQRLEAVGTLRAVKGADLSLEVSGVVDGISFNSGDDVEEGALLLKLRAEDDVAKLESLEAAARLSQLTYERDLKQLKILVGHLKEGQFLTKFRKTFTKGEMEDDLLIVPAKLDKAEDHSEYEEVLPTSPP